MSNGVIDSCARDLRVGAGSLSDARQVQTGFNQFSDKVRANMNQGMSKGDAVANTPALIPSSAAVGGATDKVRSGQVQQMIKCVGDKTGVEPGVTSELQGMYRDAVSAERFKQDPSITNGLKSLFGR